METTIRGVCISLLGGHAWLLHRGWAWDMTRYRDTVNERAGRILLECILVLDVRPLMVCFHCPTLQIPIPTPIPIPMKLASIKMCRTVSTEPRLIPMPIPIPTSNGYCTHFGTYIGTTLVENLFIKRMKIIIQASGGNY